MIPPAALGVRLRGTTSLQQSRSARASGTVVKFHRAAVIRWNRYGSLLCAEGHPSNGTRSLASRLRSSEEELQRTRLQKMMVRCQPCQI
jgi:hypothetical protein